MNSERRRRARIQGGWASPSPKTSNVRSDRNKTQVQPCPVWTGKNIDCQRSPATFVYEEPTEELQEKPAERVIKYAGVYDISTEPSGVSRIRYFPNFIESDEASWMFEQLYDEIGWKRKSDVKNGQSYLQPRLTAWFGDFPYSYSGVTHAANIEWTPTLQLIKDRLEDNTGMKFNSMLANLYRDNHDHVPWHTDNESTLGPQPTVASLSFGDTRNFEMRKNPKVGNDYTYSEHLKIPLSSGTLLIMENYTQDDWQHRIPIEYHDRGARINLTFRIIYPESTDFKTS